MNKPLKKISIVFLAIIIMCSFFTLTASAAATSSISLSSKRLTVNQALTVTVSVNGGEAMYGTEFNVNYDPAVLRFDSGDSASGGAGSIKVVGTPAGATKQSYNLNFTALAAGTSTVAVVNCIYVGDAELSFTGSSVSISVTDAAQSANADLKSLTLSSGALSPKFSAAKTSYSVSVPYSVTQCKIYATASDSAAKVAVSGGSSLNVGATTRTVTVTAPSGAQKVYTIAITRLEEGADANEPETQEPDPYQTVIGNASYKVLNDISTITLPKGFAATTGDYNGAAVAVATDENSDYKIFYLKALDSETVVPYVLDTETKTFEKLKAATFGENFYIFADYPEEYTVAEDYYSTNIEIGEFKLPCFASNDSKMQGFYYLYCYTNGNYSMYRYDSTEKVLQRDPQFEMLSVTEENSKTVGLVERFSDLSTNAKVIVICIIVGILGALILIVLFIVKMIRRKNYSYDNSGDVIFDSIRSDASLIGNDDLNDEIPDEKVSDLNIADFSERKNEDDLNK